ncbi:endosome-associated-trafficking regulator 1, partial [Lates japonicus]
MLQHGFRHSRVGPVLAAFGLSCSGLCGSLTDRTPSRQDTCRPFTGILQETPTPLCRVLVKRHVTSTANVEVEDGSHVVWSGLVYFRSGFVLRRERRQDRGQGDEEVEAGVNRFLLQRFYAGRSQDQTRIRTRGGTREQEHTVSSCLMFGNLTFDPDPTAVSSQNPPCGTTGSSKPEVQQREEEEKEYEEMMRPPWLVCVLQEEGWEEQPPSRVMELSEVLQRRREEEGGWGTWRAWICSEWSKSLHLITQRYCTLGTSCTSRTLHCTPEHFLYLNTSCTFRPLPKRAVKAENSVSRLKVELQQLQVEVESLRAENISLKTAESQVVMTMRQNAQMASEYLNKTTSHAHSSIR